MVALEFAHRSACCRLGASNGRRLVRVAKSLIVSSRPICLFFFFFWSPWTHSATFQLFYRLFPSGVKTHFKTV